MAIRWAVGTGNWGTAATWNDPGGGATVPGNGDAVYLNNKTVTVDQDIAIGGANNSDVNAGSFIAGCRYKIKTVGNTSFSTIGAADNNVGTIFVATAAGSGTGVATTVATIHSGAWAPLSIAAGGYLTFTSGARTITCDLYQASAYCIQHNGTQVDHVLNIVGDVYGAYSSGRCIYAASATGTLNITGTLYTVSGTNSYAVDVSGSTVFNMSLSGDVKVYGGYGVNWSNNHASSRLNQLSGSHYGTSYGIYMQNAYSPSFTCGAIEHTGGNAIALSSCAGTVNLTATTIKAGTTDYGIGMRIDQSSGKNITINVTATDIMGAPSGTPTIQCAGIYTGMAYADGRITLNITATNLTGAAASGAGSAAVRMAYAYVGLTITGGLYAGPTSAAVEGTISTDAGTPCPIISGSTYDNVNGQVAVLLNRRKTNVTPTTQVRREAVNGSSTTFTFVTPDVAAMPPVDKVQAGYVYAGGGLTGTALVDASSLTIPSAADVAAAVRTNLATELGRLDAAVSTRMATFSYTAPPSAADNAAAIAAALTIPSAADNAAALRSNLATELARINQSATIGSTWEQLALLLGE